MGHKEHRAHAPKSITIAVLSISTSRDLQRDESGHWIARHAAREGHQVLFHDVVTDDMEQIRGAVRKILADPAPDAVIMTGGTGIAPRDVTIEAVRPLFAKELTGFSTLFTQLSYEEVDAAAMISRAAAGVIGRTLFFCLPGSLKACRLACKNLIFPELGHLVGHLSEN